jgi:cell division protein FtsW
MTNTTEHKNHIGPLKHPMDKLLFLLTLTLLCVGVVTVYDASYAGAIEHIHGDSLHYVKLQAAWAVVGMVVMLATRYIPYWKWRKFAVAGVAISAILLVAVLIPHVGILVGGARRWVGHGGIRIQPSELAKLALILYMAHITSQAPRLMKRLKIGFVPPLLVIGILAVLTAKEPDLGTAIVIAGTGLVMLYLAGAQAKHLLVTVTGVGVAVALYSVSSAYRMERLSSWLDPRGERLQGGYQNWHALIALGSGGVTGFGLGEGREKLYIPAARTDFIFAVIGEEWGLIGTIALVALFTLLAARGYSIAYQTKDPFGSLLAAGVTTAICLQSLVNMGVATASIPNTGVPLPFLSYGGSSLVLMMAGIGLLLNISSHPEGPPASEAGRPGRSSQTPSRPPQRLHREPASPGREANTRIGRQAMSAQRRVDRVARRPLGLYRN